MISRRSFLQSSLSLSLVPLLPRGALAATTLRIRPDWPTFRTSTMFDSFVSAIAAMKANTNSADPDSWRYWTDVHRNFCPHGKAYFLAWHRGFLYRLEYRLRKVSGNGSLVLPYWNYYDDPRMPSDFLDPASPLYRAKRTGDDVTGALSLDPFSDLLTYFQRGKPDAFEPVVESRPHNGVHNLIGGVMANVSWSPLDPIFWVHHANIDRLWAAWVAAGNGRHMPKKTASYWSGSFNFGAGVRTMARVGTYSTSGLGYRYADETMPTVLPGGARVQPLESATMQSVLAPATGSTAAIGGVAGMGLDQRSAAIRMPLTAADRARIRTVLTRPGEGVPTAIRVVLDGVQLTPQGARGGYFYNVFINRPATGAGQPDSAYQIGTLGPFEVDAARRMAAMGMGGTASGRAQVILPAADVLRRLWPQPLDEVSISFVRVDGVRPAAGTVITVDQVSVQIDQ